MVCIIIEDGPAMRALIKVTLVGALAASEPRHHASGSSSHCTENFSGVKEIHPLNLLETRASLESDIYTHCILTHRVIQESSI